MFCTKCGAQNGNDAKFCLSCGNPLETPTPAPVQEAPQPQSVNTFQQPAPVAQPVPQPAVQQPVAVAQPVTTSALKPKSVIYDMKTLATSPLFLVAVIVYTLTFLISVLSLLEGMPVPQYLLTLAEYVPELDLHELLIAYDSTYIIFGVIGLLPTILTLLGYWLIFGSGVNKSSETMGTGGLTLLKVLNVISLVFTCIGAAFILIMLIVLTLATVGISAEFETGAAVPVTIVAWLVAIVWVIFSIVYRAKVVGSLSAAKTTIQTNKPTDGVSAFVAVLLIIGGAFGIIFGLISVVGSIVLGGFFSALSSCVTALANLLMGIYMFRVRGKISELKAKQI